MTPIQAIQAWYSRQCNGDWEHRYGVSIETIDNPGWWVKIDLMGTPHADQPFETVSRAVSADGREHGPVWMHCRVEENTFHGSGSPDQLEEILRVFVEWANRLKRSDPARRDGPSSL